MLGAGGGFALIAVLQFAGMRHIWVYTVIGIVIWYLTFESGVHATIAGVILGLMTPAHPYRGRRVMESIEHRLLPYSNFIIVPIFALANAGVVMTVGTLQEAFSESIAWGIVLGLVAGKTGGVFIATFLGVRLGIGRLSPGVSLLHAFGGAMLAGIGFTVALFIAELSFEDALLLDEAKIGVFAGSLVAGLAGVAFLYVISRKSTDAATEST
jgi:Na+:H+ antiporter, NhaA family